MREPVPAQIERGGRDGHEGGNGNCCWPSAFGKRQRDADLRQKTDQYVDMIAAGIIDPAKVVRMPLPSRA